MSKNRKRQQSPRKSVGENSFTKKVDRKSVKKTDDLQMEEGRTNLTLRRRVANFLLGIFALNAVGTLAVVFFVGFGLMALSNTIIISLIGETVAHAATMFLAVTKYLFPIK